MNKDKMPEMHPRQITPGLIDELTEKSIDYDNEPNDGMTPNYNNCYIDPVALDNKPDRGE